MDVLAVVGLLCTIVGIGVGALISTALHRNATRQLEHTSNETHRLLNLTLRALELGGLAELNRAEDGTIRGINFRIETQPGHYTLDGQPVTLRVTRADGAVEDR
jgi:hypothetical protein